MWLGQVKKAVQSPLFAGRKSSTCGVAKRKWQKNGAEQSKGQLRADVWQKFDRSSAGYQKQQGKWGKQTCFLSKTYFEVRIIIKLMTHFFTLKVSITFGVKKICSKFSDIWQFLVSLFMFKIVYFHFIKFFFVIFV